MDHGLGLLRLGHVYLSVDISNMYIHNILILLMEEIPPVDMANIPLFTGFYTSQLGGVGFLPSTVSTTDTMCSKGQCEYPLESTCPSIYSLNEANVQNSNTSFIFSVFNIHIWSILVKPVGKNSLK